MCRAVCISRCEQLLGLVNAPACMFVRASAVLVLAPPSEVSLRVFLVKPHNKIGSARSISRLLASCGRQRRDAARDARLVGFVIEGLPLVGLWSLPPEGIMRIINS